MPKVHLNDKQIWFIGDTHFGHEKIITDYTRLEFGSIEEHDEAIIESWNEVVGKNDLVYHLGDVAWNKKAFEKLRRLNGHLKLIMGNHDANYSTNFLMKYFQKLYGSAEIDGEILLTHMPTHKIGLKRRWVVNIHGHIHAHQVLTWADRTPDPIYLNVSWEQFRRPISLQEVREMRWCLLEEIPF